METGKPFTCTFVTYDAKRDRGGELREYEAKLIRNNPLQKQGGRPLTPKEKQEKALAEASVRNPHHSKHFTRNVQVLQDSFPTSMIRKIHPLLLTKFNGSTVVL